jgi:hypothetical protein
MSASMISPVEVTEVTVVNAKVVAEYRQYAPPNQMMLFVRSLLFTAPVPEGDEKLPANTLFHPVLQVVIRGEVQFLNASLIRESTVE